MRSMKFAMLAATALLLSACVTSLAGQPEPFHTPEDCFNLAKHSHPEYINACGNSQ